MIGDLDQQEHEFRWALVGGFDSRQAEALGGAGAEVMLRALRVASVDVQVVAGLAVAGESLARSRDAPDRSSVIALEHLPIVLQGAAIEIEHVLGGRAGQVRHTAEAK